MKANISLNNGVYSLLFQSTPAIPTIFTIKYFSFSEVEGSDSKEFSALKVNINLENLITFLRDEKINLNKWNLSMSFSDVY